MLSRSPSLQFQLSMVLPILVRGDLRSLVANPCPSVVRAIRRSHQHLRGKVYNTFHLSLLNDFGHRSMNSRGRVDDRAVIQVLQNCAQRVTDEAESQFVATSPPKQGEIHALVKQKHVLEQTMNAYDKALSGQGHLQARRLAVAAQHVVLQAAQTIVADRGVAVGGVQTSEGESVSMHELTDKTQDAIAMAVKMNGPASTEVDIIVTATSILKHSTPAAMAAPSSTPRISSAFPPPTGLSTLPEHV